MEYIIRDTNGVEVYDTDEANYFISREGRVVQVRYDLVDGEEQVTVGFVENAKPLSKIPYHELIKVELERSMNEFAAKFASHNNGTVLDYEIRQRIRRIPEGEYVGEAALSLEVKERGRSRVLCEKKMGFNHVRQMQDEMYWKNTLYRGMLDELVAVALGFEDSGHRIKTESKAEKEFKSVSDINTSLPEGKLLLAMVSQMASLKKTTMEEVLEEILLAKKAIYRE